MRHTKKKLMTALAIASTGICANFLDGCIARYQTELEVLAAPQSNPTLIKDSYLVDWFGPNVIEFFQDWW